jgi:hypothetical protein
LITSFTFGGCREYLCIGSNNEISENLGGDLCGNLPPGIKK